MFDLMRSTLISNGAIWTILKGLLVTFRISIFALLFGTVLGLIICAARSSKIWILRTIAQIYISIMRGSPVLMLLLLMYYVIFAKTRISAEYVAIVTYSLNVAAYIAEVMRSARSAIDEGQVSAARTLGFSKWQAFWLVTFPQARRIAAPVYESTIINMVQWTSVVGYVSITDLTRVINQFSARTMKPVFMIIVGMIIYLAMSYIVTGIFALVRKLERRGEED